jgi:hypothetical protein
MKSPFRDIRESRFQATLAMEAIQSGKIHASRPRRAGAAFFFIEGLARFGA